MAHNGIFANALNQLLENNRAAIVPSDVIHTPIPHLAYWHAKLLFARYTHRSPTNISDMLSYASNIRDVINKTNLRDANDSSSVGVRSLGPLAHHAYIFCAVTLSEIVDLKEKRDEALKIARDMLFGLESYRVGESKAFKDRKACWGNAVVAVLRGVLEKGGKQDGDGLQQLANAVVGVGEGNGERDKDWGEVGRRGYLNLAAKDDGYAT